GNQAATQGYASVLCGNMGTGRNNLRLYNTNLTAPISASNIPDAQFGAGLYAKPFLGRQRTRMVWETRSQGQAFSSAGGRITNSTASTAQQAATTQTAVAGTELKTLVDKLQSPYFMNATKVRARLRYSLVTALTGQVYSPWRYMPGYLDGLGTHSNIPLPVELLYFSADCEQGKPLLQWATGSERNSSHYAIERSADGTTWEQVGAMPAAGNSQQMVEYHFVDQQPSAEALVYYRLRQADLDGGEEVFDAVPLMNCGSDGVALVAYPNPAGDVVYLTSTLSTGAEGPHTLELMDGTGRVVMSTAMDLSTGQCHTALELAGLAQGTYVVALRDGGGSVLAQTRVVKQ
ncbi:MAG: T9SS type A sorting domain-containing protein, partial [Flavobacteriales bacterium]